MKGTRSNNYWSILEVTESRTTPSAFTCPNSATETLGQGVKYVQS